MTAISSAGLRNLRCCAAGSWMSAVDWWPWWARGGIGKTSLVAKLSQDVVPRFERVYWRSLRDALQLSEWLAGGFERGSVR
jgi:hypothetical protein